MAGHVGFGGERRPDRGMLPGSVRHPCLNEPPQAIHGLLSARPDRDAASVIDWHDFFSVEGSDIVTGTACGPRALD